MDFLCALVCRSSPGPGMSVDVLIAVTSQADGSMTVKQPPWELLQA